MIQAIILAGGKGTRLGKLTENTPKSLIKIGPLSILEHQIKLLKRYGFKEIIILTGYLSEIIEKFVDEHNFYVKIKCLKSDPAIGNADRVKLAQKYLKNNFLILYGDVMLNIDLKRLINFHYGKKSYCTLVLHPNDHPFDSNLVEIDENQKIIAFHSKPHPPKHYLRNLVNAGVYIMSPKIFKYIKSKPGLELDFGKQILPKIIKKENVFGYITPEYLKDMGTPERLKQVTRDYLSGKIRRSNMKNKRKVIFLDRDGVISYDSGNLSNINDFYLLPNVAKAVKMINSSEYLAIVVTNQPMVAKGLMSIKDVEQINKKMETMFGETGAKLDGIYFCPHHPEKGYPGENSKYTILCDCRKPQIGMLKRAQKDFNIDLAASWIVGDSERDVIAGYNAKTNKILVKKNQEKFDECRLKTKKANSLYSAVKFILNKK